MKEFVVFSVFLCLLIVPLNAVEKNLPHDGYLWTENDNLPDVATWYKLGYLNGCSHAQARLADELYALSLLAPPDDRCGVLLTTVVDGWSSYYGVGGIAFGQMIDGLDEFYKDWKNRQIDVLDALYIVKLESQGTSVDDIDKTKRLLRLPREKVWQMLLSDTVSQADKNVLLRNALKGQ